MIKRHQINTPDGGTTYVDEGYHSAPKNKPYHLVGSGLNFSTIQEAQDWINSHWFDTTPQQPDSFIYGVAPCSYERACGRFD